MLVVGYGRVGKLVGDMLSRHDIAWVAAERDVRLVEAGRRARSRRLVRRRVAAPSSSSAADSNKRAP